MRVPAWIRWLMLPAVAIFGSFWVGGLVRVGVLALIAMVWLSAVTASKRKQFLRSAAAAEEPTPSAAAPGVPLPRRVVSTVSAESVNAARAFHEQTTEQNLDIARFVFASYWRAGLLGLLIGPMFGYLSWTTHTDQSLALHVVGVTAVILGANLFVTRLHLHRGLWGGPDGSSQT